jgi:hypothetical protein
MRDVTATERLPTGIRDAGEPHPASSGQENVVVTRDADERDTRRLGGANPAGAAVRYDQNSAAAAGSED